MYPITSHTSFRIIIACLQLGPDDEKKNVLELLNQASFAKAILKDSSQISEIIPFLPVNSEHIFLWIKYLNTNGIEIVKTHHLIALAKSNKIDASQISKWYKNLGPNLIPYDSLQVFSDIKAEQNPKTYKLSTDLKITKPNYSELFQIKKPLLKALHEDLGKYTPHFSLGTKLQEINTTLNDIKKLMSDSFITPISLLETPFLKAEKKAPAFYKKTASEIGLDSYPSPLPGPNPCNIPTTIISTILAYCLRQPSDIAIYLNTFLDEIIISLPDGTNFNLSLLLKNADLSQVIIPDDLFELYDAYLAQPNIFHKPIEDTIKPEGHLAKLHPAVLKAINLYTSSFYKIVNSICRGKIPENISSHLFKSYVLEALYVAIFSSYGLQQYYLLQMDPLTRISEPVAKRLYRRINHSPKQGFYLREQTILSTTIDPKPSPYFKHRKGLVLMENTGMFPLISSISSTNDPLCPGDEKEVALPAGTVLRYKEMMKSEGMESDESGENYKNIYEAEIVKSFEIIDPNGYNALVGEALRFAHVHYLSLHYTDEDAKVLPRPNHGLVHVARTLAYVEKVIEYFSSYANQHYKPFFYQLCPLKTKIALTFYVTGRDNEKSFAESPEEYKLCRKLSAKHFKEYVKGIHNQLIQHTNNPELKFSKDELSIYHEVLEFSGNPLYLLNLIKNDKEEVTAGFKIALWHVLTLAHCLDLARCYNADQFRSATEDKFIHVINQSLEQRIMLSHLQAFAIKLISKTDDHSLCNVEEKSVLVDSREYRRGYLFQRYSQSVKRCEAVIDAVLFEDKSSTYDPLPLAKAESSEIKVTQSLSFFKPSLQLDSLKTKENGMCI